MEREETIEYKKRNDGFGVESSEFTLLLIELATLLISRPTYV